MSRARWVRALFIFLLAAGFSAAVQAAERFHTTALGNAAVGGYDAVAYFTEGKPLKGLRKFTFRWQGANWRFASMQNMDLFKSNPEKYAPRYGGHCAWAVSARKMLYRGNPRSWQIVDGALYLNHNPSVEKRWLDDVSGHIQKADTVWDELNEDR
ncbi:YHS domain-containing protein [Sansalvadorimonas sp. 2012CJ34-2]|uniref:YHS domain-containing protein n=1 Tax=Parendozoicomonas callyspongiae TaxID=2942213 RepID=A0ABT0PAQ7_9GAMM|nr:YHS domain-containing (seleno)protein [Sansalvadorimonas sp. 2012CJ34-2]MCL6268405.1 YHS domain-containing protein [Sansalvadorimonas sp. 2012CJ34-2]